MNQRQAYLLLRQVSVVDHDLEHEEGRDGELVALEHPAAHVVEDRLGDAVDQHVAALGQLLVVQLALLLLLHGLDLALGPFDRLLRQHAGQVDAAVEDEGEGRERVDVVRVDLDQVVHEEEEQRRAVGHRAVLLRRDLDVRLQQRTQNEEKRGQSICTWGDK